jgi:hypothetical protein
VPADQILADYDHWLDREALAARTRASSRRWVSEFVAHLDAGDELQTFLARDGEHDRRAVLGDWRRRLIDRGLAPSAVNLALAAATSLLDSHALSAPRVPRGGLRDVAHTARMRAPPGWRIVAAALNFSRAPAEISPCGGRGCSLRHRGPQDVEGGADPSASR